MKPSEIFGIILRTAGLYLAWLAAREVPNLFEFAPIDSASLILRRIGPLLFASMWLLRGAPLIMKYAYGSADKQRELTVETPQTIDFDPKTSGYTE